MLKVILLALTLVSGCAAQVETPLECDASTIETDKGLRLLVSCNRPVETPPEACNVVATATYECNILHASADDCATFPGICKVP